MGSAGFVFESRKRKPDSGSALEKGFNNERNFIIMNEIVQHLTYIQIKKKIAVSRIQDTSMIDESQCPVSRVPCPRIRVGAS